MDIDIVDDTHYSITAQVGPIYSDDGDDGVIALRNPTDEETSLTLTLNKLMGAPEDLQGAKRFNVYCKSLEETDETYAYNSKMDLTMKPFEIMIFKIGKEK